MKMILSLIIGAIGGFFIHAISMKISFKQRAIDNKIKVYATLISHWVQMRNQIYASPNTNPHNNQNFDQAYGRLQAAIGEAVLVCEDDKLTEDINKLSEKIYHTDWGKLEHEKVNETMEELKKKGWGIITRMRKDIKKDTRFDRDDFVHIFKGFKSNNS
ncbi:MAG: hypothetical protein ABIE75_03150 [Candidatus Omnitrophota bacterium]